MLSFKMTVYFLQHNLSYPNLYKEAYIHNIWISGVRYFLNIGRNVVQRVSVKEIVNIFFFLKSINGIIEISCCFRKQF